MPAIHGKTSLFSIQSLPIRRVRSMGRGRPRLGVLSVARRFTGTSRPRPCSLAFLNSLSPDAAGCLCSIVAALPRLCWKRGPAVSRLRRVRRKTLRWPARDADSESAESLHGLDPRTVETLQALIGGFLPSSCIRVVGGLAGRTAGPLVRAGGLHDESRPGPLTRRPSERHPATQGPTTRGCTASVRLQEFTIWGRCGEVCAPGTACSGALAKPRLAAGATPSSR